MNSKKTGPQPGSKPDDLIRSNTVELTEEDLGSVSGGIKIGSKTESLLDQKHKDEIHIESLKPLWTHK
jgi:hypothetical protein